MDELTTLSTINLNWLRVFDRVMQDRNLTIAAESLGLTQSALSHTLKQLRDALGDPLFLKTPVGVAPTAAALDIAEEIHTALQMMQGALRKPEFEPSSSRREYSIACVDYAVATMIPQIALDLRKSAPSSQLVLKRVDKDIARRLKDGEVDLLINAAGSFPEWLESCPLFDDEFVWTVSRSWHDLHPDATRTTISALQKIVVSFEYAELDEEIGGFTRRNYLQLWNSNASASSECMERNASIVVNGFMPAVILLEQSDLVCALPLKFVSAMAERFAISIVAPVEGSKGGLTLLWHHEYGNRAATKWFRNLVLGRYQDVLPASSNPG